MMVLERWISNHCRHYLVTAPVELIRLRQAHTNIQVGERMTTLSIAIAVTHARVSDAEVVVVSVVSEIGTVGSLAAPAVGSDFDAKVLRNDQQQRVRELLSLVLADAVVVPEFSAVGIHPKLCGSVAKLT